MSPRAPVAPVAGFPHGRVPRTVRAEQLLDVAEDLFATVGFNVIATANTRDLGVNEMSAALKRRFNFETVFPIAQYETELALVIPWLEARHARCSASYRGCSWPSRCAPR